MGVVISLVFGWGAWLILDGFMHPPREPRPRSSREPWLQRQLNQAGLAEMAQRTIWLASIACAFVGGLLGLIVSGQAVLGLMAAMAASSVPIVTVRSRINRRRREFSEAWPDAVDNLTSAIRAGLSLPEALIALSETGPEALRPSFLVFAQDYQRTGRFIDALETLKRQLSDPVGDRIVESLRIAREVGGGDIAQMMRTLSAFLREDMRTRAELEARQSWTVSGARLAVAAPWVVLLMMSTGSSGLAAFNSGLGFLVLTSGAVVCAVAYYLMLRLGRLPAEQRVLVS